MSHVMRRDSGEVRIGHLRVQVCMYACTYVCMYLCVYVCMYVCVICVCACVSVFTLIS